MTSTPDPRDDEPRAPASPTCTYPWEGGTWVTDVRVFAEGEPDEDGEPLPRPMIGLGDYVDSGEPDLCFQFPPGTDLAHVEWVALALEWYMATRPQGVCEDADEAGDEAGR